MLRRAVGLVWGASRFWFAASAASILLQAFAPLLLIYLIKLLIDAITELSGSGAALDAGRAWDALGWLLLAAAGAAILQGAVGALGRMVAEIQAQVVTDHMAGRLHEQATRVDLGYYEQPQFRDTLHRAQRNASQRPTRILMSLLELGRNGASLVVMGGVLVSFHWAVLPLLAVVAAPGALLRLRYSSDYYSWEQRATMRERLAAYYNEVLNTEGYAKDVRLFGLGPVFRQRFRALRDRLRRERIVKIRNRSLAELLGEVLTVAGVFAVMGLLGYSVLLGSLTVGSLVMYFAALQRSWQHLGQGLRAVGTLYEDNLFLRDLYAFLDTVPTVSDPAVPVPVPRPFDGPIRFERVSFTYPTQAQPTLHEVSIEIRPGEHVAFVGRNGSGKSTMVKLLCRLYDVDSGAITVAGTDLRGFALQDWRDQLGVLTQDFARYQQTARENVWLGDPRLDPCDARIEAAAATSGAAQVFARLPQGYETILGHRFKGGSELSVGQWQKVALSRLFVRDAQLLILDEPTSAMDAEAEDQALRQFRELARGRTTVLISHRLSAVRTVDRIFMLADGRIVESGAHDELIARGGAYAELYELQARRYKD